MVRLSTAWRRYPAWRVASIVAVAALVISIGVTVALTSRREDSWYSFTFGVVFALVGLGLFVTAWSLMSQNRFPRGLPPVRSVTLDGERATFVPRWAFPVWQGCMFMLILGGGALGWIALGLVEGDYGWLVVGVPACVGTLSFPAFVVAGRVKAGGLWLTPTRVVHRLYGAKAEVQWEDVRSLDLGHSGVLLWTDQPKGGYTVPWWRGKKILEEDRVVVDGDFLALSPTQVLRLLDEYLRLAGRRVELGTDAAMCSVEAVRLRAAP